MSQDHGRIFYRRYLPVCFALLLTCAAMAAAQEPGAANESIIFPEALKGLSISDRFVPLFARRVGTVQSVKGRLIVRHGESLNAYQAGAGNELYEHDVLFTLGESRCRLKFVTGDVITMGTNSSVSVDEMVDERDRQEKKSSFAVLKGKVMFYVLRLFRYKKVDFNVRTPTVVAGIRGTKFGIEVARTDHVEASARQPYLADISGVLPSGLLARNNPGEGFQTTVYGFDGEVQVTSAGDGSTQTVGAGEHLVVGSAGAGSVTPTPPADALQFNQETSAPGAGEGGESGGGNTEPGGTGAKAADFDQRVVDFFQQAADFSQEQTNLNIAMQAAASATPDFKSANGSQYGLDGQYMGGAWGMPSVTGVGAAGIFQGQKYDPISHDNP